MRPRIERSRRSTPHRPSERPLVVAHRGASAQIAEHTLAAYVAAIESGADALECDVRLTRDGHLICVHDRTVNRTSDGAGVVSEFDLAGLSGLDFASWHEDWPDSADRLLRNEPYLAGVAPDRIGPQQTGVLTLETLLGLVHDSSRPVQIFIETKHPTRYAGLVEKELVRLLVRFGWSGRPGVTGNSPARRDDDQPGRATVMSFAPTALRRVRLLAPDVPTVLLLDRLTPTRRSAPVPTAVSIVGPSLAIVRADPEFVRRSHARGRSVYVWTVDATEDIDLVLSLGVDAVISNRPADVMRRITVRSDRSTRQGA